MAGVFHMTILGRTIEHLGTQMYKHRAPSIAELVANAWDAGATNIWIDLPSADNYSQARSVITIMDDGEGMDENSVEHHYLVVGRNRRSDDGGVSHGRKVMGRKGIGKLAGFGLAGKVTLTTWTKTSEKAIQFSMSLADLKKEAGQVDNVPFPWVDVDIDESWPESGTLITLSDLRHNTPIDATALTETLARRFSRTTRGSMEIAVNSVPVPDPSIEMMHVAPATDDFIQETLPSGKPVRYRYGFAEKPIRSKELQGFVIYSRERTAQAPPFFFNVESTASSQHSTRYISGEIVAEFLDDGVDSESDVISTDRQELDWERDDLTELREWGEALSRRLLRECAEMKGQELEHWILQDSDFSKRLILLDPASRNQISGFLKVLGQKSPKDDERTRDLANSLIRAYEFRTFHDVIEEIEDVGADPERLEEMLGRLHDWKVLESRAILEIVRGRLSIIGKLENMIVNDAPETASSTTHDNLHDLLAEYPWIVDPDWQVFVEEKSIGRQLREWGVRDCPEEMKNKRVDFLAFARGTDELVIIELKRPGHAVEFDEVQRLEQYQVQLMKARPNCRRVLVYGGTVNIPPQKWDELLKAQDFQALTWGEMFARARAFYAHYEAVLSGDATAEGFVSKEAEVARTRQILESGSSHRSAEDRKRGLGESQP
jgi:histidine kinase/DNA gyrase B/HSP90-like ATPase